jgi:hypothetical protein
VPAGASLRMARAPLAFGRSLEDELASFRDFGRPTALGELKGVPVFRNEFWTSKQRAAHSLHEISYRACFKPQLPRFFIERLTAVGETVYDPFLGRGTTALEAALLRRRPYGCDVNPLSGILLRPRLEPPTVEQVAERLRQLDWRRDVELRRDLEVFYHPRTLHELSALRAYLLEREAQGALDAIDRWIRMVAINRLTGHSSGFFSVYTLPPNQAVSVAAQRKINRKRAQRPPRRSVPELILRKSRALLKDLTDDERAALASVAGHALLLTKRSHDTPEIRSGSVALAITSPPFLDVVDYAADNWLRCWFAGIDPTAVAISIVSDVAAWRRMVTDNLREVARTLRVGGHYAFEVGEVRSGTIPLEEVVLEAAEPVCELEPRLIVINEQSFTKTANIWGVSNNRKGTNSNRIVLFRRRGRR